MVMLQLMQMWPVEATDWVWSSEFIPDPHEFEASYGSDMRALSRLRGAVNWYESIGTLHKYGLINEDLLFDWLALDMVWEKLTAHVHSMREETGNPHLYENFEAMVETRRHWAAERDRKAA
jgi:hypothetical protein